MTVRAESNLASYGELIRTNRNFRNLWFGQIVSLLGDWFNLIASASLLGSLTESGLAVSGLFVVRMLAPFLVSPIAGVAADRYNRKHLLIITDVLRALVVLGFLLVRRPEHVWLLYTLTFIQLGLSGFFFPARNAILPDIVSRRELGAANALSSTTWSVMLAFGAALGGIVAGRWGAYPSFIVDSLTFIGSVFFIVRVGYTHIPPLEDADASVGAAVKQYVDGLRYLVQHADIFAITLHKPAYALLISGGFQVIQVILAEEVFVIGKEGGTSLGLMYAAVGIGTGLGTILARVFTGDRLRAQRVALVVAYGIGALGMVLIAPLWGFGMVLLGTLLRGIGSGINWVFSTQLLLELLPDRVRGRVFSSEFAMQTLMNAGGALAAGWALDGVLDMSGVMFWMAGLILVPGVLWLLWMRFGTEAAPPPGADDGDLPSLVSVETMGRD